MKQFKGIISKAFCSIVLLTVICGLIYPSFMTVVAQVIFPTQANGSIIEVNGEKYGSILLGQQFTGNEYLWGRIMEIDVETYQSDNGEALMYASPSNISPASEEYEALIEARVDKIKTAHPEMKDTPIPVDLVTVSGSGLDPHISVSAANYQVQRLARERNLSVEDVQSIIEKHTTKKLFGFLGEDVVNVLEVNLELDGIIE